MKPLRVYLLRHGEPADTKVFYGHDDVALSPRGHAQISSQVGALADARLDAVYTSDLTRARLGADAIAVHHGLAPVVDPSLREMHLGDLEGLPYRKAADQFPELASRSYREMLDFRMPGGGESVRDLAERVLPFVGAAVLRHAGEGGLGIAIYAHNTVVRVLLAVAAGAGVGGYGRFEQGYGALNRVDIDRRQLALDPWAAASIAYSNRLPPG